MDSGWFSLRFSFPDWYPSIHENHIAGFELKDYYMADSALFNGLSNQRQKPIIQGLLYFVFCSVLLTTGAHAQNNGVFNGGTGYGWTQEIGQTPENSSIFNGAHADGFTFKTISKPSNSAVFSGAVGDGYSMLQFSLKTNHEIFLEGIGDGCDQFRVSKTSNNSIFAGGHNDGHDRDLTGTIINHNVYAGGPGDGYSNSGLSKLIWTGSTGKDWLVASNWNLNRIPTLSDQVVIPAGVPNNLLLKGKLLIDKAGTHLYTCQSLLVLPQGIINSTNEAWLENHGEILTSGLITLFHNPQHQHSNHFPATIIINQGGELKIIN